MLGCVVKYIASEIK